jgi:hypothetical protein
MDWTVATYVAYLLVAVPLTVWVARTLSSNGQVFLEDVFTGSEALARAVNRLLVVGFYLLNLGFVSLYLRSGADVVDLRGLLEQLSVKIGVVTLVLGVVHFLNVWVFSAMRRRQRMDSFRSAPVAPQGYVGPMGPVGPLGQQAPYPAPGR